MRATNPLSGRGPGPDLYAAYTSAGSEAAAAEALNELFSAWLMPWCREAVKRGYSCYGLRDTDRADLEAETAADVLMAMAVRLRATRTGEAEPVENLRAYLASTVQNACFARIRARCPQHVQLQNRIRYLLRNDSRFAGWQSAAGEQLGGTREWKDRDAAVPCPEIQRGGFAGNQLGEAMQALFRLAEGPVRVSELLRAMAATFGVADRGSAPVDPDSIASGEPATERNLIERETLGAMWREVLELPGGQRAALLLNLRDGEGNGVIELLPATGVTTFAELAASVGMTEAELARLWPELPLEDARIAELLALTRQQVINLRKSARDRLGRRMQKMSSNTGRTFSSRESGSILARAGSAIGAILRRKGDA